MSRCCKGMVPLLAALLVQVSLGAALDCRDDLNEADGYTIRHVTVEGRWTPPLSLPIKAGDRFSNARVQEAMRAVRAALHEEDRRGLEFENLGALGLTHITRCLRVEGRQVDVSIQVHAVRVDLLEIGGNVLPIPRSGLATFYQAVPAPLLALHPRLGAYQDEHFGFAPSAALDANLLGLTRSASPDRNTRLDFAADGRKSIEHSFFDANASLALRRLFPGEAIEQVDLTAAFAGKDEPQGDRSLRREAGTIAAGLRFRPPAGSFRTVLLEANYHYSANGMDFPGQDTAEHALGLRAVAEGRAGGGFVRAAAWGEAGFPDHGDSYGRIAALLAYEKEFLVAPSQTIGLEVIAGGGEAWSAPAYARFFGGNSERNFLFDAVDAPSLHAFPAGPLIRSLGEGQAGRGDRGSSRYWHLNVNLSLPIPRLSRPLIPNEEVAPGITLPRLLQNKASDSVAFYAEQLEEEGLSPEAALAKAKRNYGEVEPAIEFIATRANVYALKPLLLVDLTGQDGAGFQAAAGGGLQLTIVTAKMEAGYMQTISGRQSGSGNLFARIVFQNLF